MGYLTTAPNSGPCRVVCSPMGKKRNSPANSFQTGHHSSMAASASSLYPLNYLSGVPLSPRSHQLQQQRERPSLLRTVLNLTGCVMGVAGSICYEVTSYWTKTAADILFRNNYAIQTWKRKLEQASTFEEWTEAAAQLDRLKGHEEWKMDPVSNDYDFELIQTRLEQFRVAREMGDLDAISFLLRASMTRGLGDIGNLELYSQSYTGTKKLIEEFNEELILALEYMYQSLGEDNRTSRRSKYEFFRGLRHMLGNTALLLSGGGALGTHHIGVLEALHEAGLLPRIISGSSSGSIMAAMVCTRTEDELVALMRLEGLNMNFLDEPSVGPGWQQYWVKLRRLMREGVVFDQSVLRACLRENIGHVTFLEAFKKTRRILNVSVSSSTRHEMPRMLNYLTAPNVLIWSAVLASCAVPGVFMSSGLLAKDPRSGALIPWHPGDDDRWIDGSVENDIPRARLAELFNVNHFIVSQVNPHVYPFLERKRREPGPPSRITHLLRTVLYLVHSETCFRLHQLISLNLIFPNALHRLLSILTQKYDGDITVIPDLTLADVKLLFADPSQEQMASSVRRGARATWPLISVVWNQCRVEILLDQLLSKMKRRTSVIGGNVSSTSGAVSVPSTRPRKQKIKKLSSSSSTVSSSTGSVSSVDSSVPTSPKGHFRRSSSPLVYRALEASASIDDLTSEFY